MNSRTTRGALALVSVLASLFSGALSVVAPSASADPSGVTVTWPSITAFNPDTTDYVVDVQAATSEHLYAYFSPAPYYGYYFVRELPGSGQYGDLIPADTFDGLGSIVIQACSGEPGQSDCSTVSESPRLSVWRALRLTPGGQTWIGPNAPIKLAVEPAGATIDVDWQFVDLGAVVAEGSFAGIPGDGKLPPIGEQAKLVPGRIYDLHVAASGDVEQYGHLVGAATMRVTWDPINDALVSVGEPGEDKWTDFTTVYPVKDHYRDRIWFKVSSHQGDLASVHLTVTGPSGEVVVDRDVARNWPYPFLTSWKPVDSSGAPLTEGQYDEVLTIRDYQGNVKVVSAALTVSHQQIVTKVWHRSFAPVDTVVGTFPDRCGQLPSPARPGWPGSMGFYTPKTCPRGNVYIAETVNRVLAPASFRDRYGEMRVSVVGGAAHGAAGSVLNVNYYKVDPRRGVVASKMSVMPGDLGRHAGEWHRMVSPAAVRSPDGWEVAQPAAYWDTYTRRPYSYDVKKFIVEVKYYVLK